MLCNDRWPCTPDPALWVALAGLTVQMLPVLLTMQTRSASLAGDCHTPGFGGIATPSALGL